MRAVQADLTDPASLREALAEHRPTHVHLTAWARQDTEEANIRVNGGIVRDVLAALSDGGSVRHVALLTGLKHYLGPFEAYGQGEMPDTPFHEDEERLPYPNFYYEQEDRLVEAAGRDGFTWSVHRAHTIIGAAVGNAMNMGQSLAAAATICREEGRPFVFPGSRTQWDGVTDMTDAGLLAEQMHWAATTRPPRTPRSTSPTATSSAGAGCGRGSRSVSACVPRASGTGPDRSRSRWPARSPCGPRSPSGRVCRSRT